MKQATAEQKIAHVAVDKIGKSYNPRTTFDPKAQKELEESIKAHGIQLPLIARWLAPGVLEMVCGERRLRAAKTLKLATVPMIVHENLSDADADAIRLIENLQREALPPLEEAEGFERLAKEHKLTKADVAARVGKSPSYVVRRMQLLKLTPRCREALRKGSIDVAGAFTLSTVADAALMDEALKQSGYRSTGDAITASDIRHTVHYRFSCQLKDATFDTKAVYEGVITGRTGHGCQLVDVGACAGCTKRTGNNEDLFGKVKGPDVCTDPPCFKAKTEAAWQRTGVEQAAKGNTVLSDADCRKVFEYESSEHPSIRSGLVRVDATCEADPKGRTWERVLGGKFTPPLVIGRNRNGTILRMAKVEDLKKSAKAAGIKLQAVRDSASGNGSQRAENKRMAEKVKIGRAVGVAALGKIAEMAPTMASLPAFQQWFTKRMLHLVASDIVCYVAKRRFPDVKRAGAMTAMEKLVPTLDGAELIGLQAELAAPGYDIYSHYGGMSRELVASCKEMGIDLKKIEAEVRKAESAKKAKKPAKAKDAKK